MVFPVFRDLSVGRWARNLTTVLPSNTEIPKRAARCPDAACGPAAGEEGDRNPAPPNTVNRKWEVRTGGLRSRPLIVIKGILFLVIILITASALLALSPDWLTAALILLLIWASARFYYFLFYVLEKYVDPSLKYSGIRDLLRHLPRRKN